MSKSNMLQFMEQVGQECVEFTWVSETMEDTKLSVQSSVCCVCGRMYVGGVQKRLHVFYCKINQTFASNIFLGGIA